MYGRHGVYVGWRELGRAVVNRRADAANVSTRRQHRSITPQLRHWVNASDHTHARARSKRRPSVTSRRRSDHHRLADAAVARPYICATDRPARLANVRRIGTEVAPYLWRHRAGSHSVLLLQLLVRCCCCCCWRPWLPAEVCRCLYCEYLDSDPQQFKRPRMLRIE